MRSDGSSRKPGTAQSLRTAFSSWRLASVSLLSFSSGLPLGLVLTAIPFWMQQEHIDIRSIGLVTLAQAPYAFKFLWSPLMDRFAPQRARKRAWVLVGQLLLSASVAALAFYAGRPTLAAISALSLLIAFSSSTQDIAVDAYTVEVLRKEEQGLAVGARVALYRAAMYVSGAILVSLGPKIGWGRAFLGLGAVFLLLVPVTVLAPEPETLPKPPVSLRAAVWDPFVSFFRHPRAIEIARASCSSTSSPTTWPKRWCDPSSVSSVTTRWRWESPPERSVSSPTSRGRCWAVSPAPPGGWGGRSGCSVSCRRSRTAGTRWWPSSA